MDDYQVLRKHALFQDLSDNDFDSLYKISHRSVIKEGNYFISEGDIEENFYLILDGKVVITKMDDHKQQHVIAYLASGDTVGEAALLDKKPRSASAKAIIQTRLIGFSFLKIKELAQGSPLFDKMLWRISSNVIGRITSTDASFVNALKNQLNEYKMRAGLGIFLMNVIIALCLFTFFLSWITSLGASTIASTIVTLPLTLGFVLLFFSIMKTSGLPLSIFGLTTQHWRKAVVESILFTAILCVIISLVKWLLISVTSKYTGRFVFEPYLTINLHSGASQLSEKEVWWMIFLSYWFIVTPIQELIVRGGLQGPLEVFLTGRFVVLKAIITSNLMFSVTHLFMGYQMAIMALFSGFYFGWLYSRHHNLIGVIIAHALLGTWGTMIVGF